LVEREVRMPEEAAVDPVELPAEPDPVPAANEPDGIAPPVALIEADLLVEDVSIDGMCGVY
jgi:mycofactocin precursor